MAVKRKTIKLCSSDNTIAMSENDPNVGVVSNVIYEGSYTHHQGKFEINETHLNEFIQNFEDKKLGIDPAINYNHEMHSKAAGWVQSIRKTDIADNRKALEMEIKWTPTAAQAIKDGEYRYFSIEFAFNMVNSETQQEVKNVITGGALTNKPFLKSTEVKLFEDGREVQGEKIKETKRMTKQEIILSLKEDHGINLSELQEKAEECKKLESQTKLLAENIKGLESKLEEIEMAKLSSEVEIVLEKLLEEGKTTKELNESMYKELFLSVGVEKAQELASKMVQIIKMEPTGSSSSNELNEEAGNVTEDEKRHKLAEKLLSENEELSYESAVEMADAKLFGGQK